MTALFEIGLVNAALATILAVAVWLITRVWRHPVVVHTLWIVVLVKLIAPPMVPIPFPLSDPNYVVASPHELSDEPVTLMPTADDQSATVGPDVHEQNATAPRDSPTTQTGKASERRSALESDWTSIIIGVWLTGSVLFLAVSAVRMWRFHSALAHAAPASHEVQEIAAALAAQLGVSNRFRLRVIDGRLSPLLWPIGKPTVLMPRQLLSALPHDELETLLAHELAHLRRKDHWVRWLELLVMTLYWWHPVVWWARVAIGRAEEHACDAWVVTILPEASRRYASALFKAVQFVSETHQASPALASAFGTSGNFKERIENIMNAKWNCRVPLPVRLIVIAAAVTILPLSLQAARADEDEPSRPSAQNVSAEDHAPSDQPEGQHSPNDTKEDSSLVRPAQSVPNPKPARRDPYRIQPGDTIHVWVHGTPNDAPINGNYLVEPSGSIALGPVYGRVAVRDFSLETAENAITEHLSEILKDPKVQVTLPAKDRELNWVLRDLLQSAAASSATESIGVLKKMVERAKYEFARLSKLRQDGVVSEAELARASSDYEISVERLRQAERGLRYHRAVLEAAEADYEMLFEAEKRAPQTITGHELRRAKLAVELAKAKLEELSE
jgi:beta-lactamase regulating signal transducer with metallopeptidase domain